MTTPSSTGPSGATLHFATAVRRVSYDERCAERIADACAPARAPMSRPIGLLAPTALCPDPLVTAVSMGLERPQQYERLIDGGSEWRWLEPVSPGEQLWQIARIIDQEERTSTRHRSATTVFEIRTWNEQGRLVAVARARSVSYEETK